MTDDQIREYHKKVNDNIKTFGYHSTFVSGGDKPSFCYSTGIYKTFGIPEIFISSLPQNLSQLLIENYTNNFKSTKEIPFNKRMDDLIDRFPIYLIDVPTIKLTDYVLSSFRFYKGENFTYVQLVYPDTKGLFPNDKGYDYDQIILGQFNC